MQVAERQCSRTGCVERAATSLSYDYERRIAWIDELVEPRDPHTYDLCSRHGERVSVPHGWSLDDRRVDRRVDRLAG